ncbi:rRNA processing protein Rrp8, putative [Talaromyces stipitatus ATCC 10500]|uniref:Ribosomal RNA-processing protein 8 n=1 Tax=Talaromyces stipitatus (strain ATCC 10500 / CBS 375.48 / QM 6759 / NRRL 1006) TaxID=441959 RepID=B8M3S7_TALSN|nr:rRNA processing protein RRP8 [Talaromyces stipitatus ATCC 10500]EED20670.1 rRNA processing protein Rrp8, putative [Talaromyces stipitatus ATCC 10500]
MGNFCNSAGGDRKKIPTQKLAMFAVPGWSLSTADLKPQKEVSSKQHATSTPTASNAATTESNENVGQSVKKRKRENGVTKSNVDEMFKRHIEGHTDKSSKKTKNKKAKDKKKEQKENKQSENNEVVQQKSAEAGEGRVNKKQKKARGEERKTHAKDDTSATTPVDNATITSVVLPPAAPTSTAKLTPLQQKMREKLMSARFRHLNETLYTTPSKQAQAMFEANPELFTEYHNGFSRQVKESWPSNPVDGYIAAVRKRGAVPAHHNDTKKHNNNAVAPLPRRPNGLCTIADLGCGDAQFARSLIPSAKKLQLKLLNFDLQSPDDSLVTKADIANLPVTDGSVDVTIFCLSLMGTNWVSFVEEAWRVLRGDGKGECWVSEVKSRFGKVNRKKAQIGLKRDEATMSNTQKKKLKNKKKKKNGNNESDEEDADEDEEIYAEDAQPGSGSNDDTDISAFVEVFKSRGFVLKQESVDKSNKMFVKMEFVKAGGAPTKGKYTGIIPAPARRNSEKSTQTKKRFIDRGDDEASKQLTAEQEAKVLKPCVYKIR